jgi:hypothetical protein
MSFNSCGFNNSTANVTTTFTPHNGPVGNQPTKTRGSGGYDVYQGLGTENRATRRRVEKAHRADPTKEVRPKWVPKGQEGAYVRRQLTKSVNPPKSKKEDRGPEIRPDDIRKSQTNDGTRQKTYLAQAKELFCSAAAPSHSDSDRQQAVIQSIASYLPNAAGISLRAISGGIIEAMRSACLGPAEVISASTDLATAAEISDRPLEWATARLIENGASDAYRALQFGDEVIVPSPNATSLPSRRLDESIDKYTSRIEGHLRAEDVSAIIADFQTGPLPEDPRPNWTFKQLAEETKGKFFLDCVPDLLDGRSLQGSTVIIMSNPFPEDYRIEDLLAAVFRPGDLLLNNRMASPSDHSPVMRHRSEAQQARECLGVDESRCISFEESQDVDMWNFIDQITEHPGRTLYIVTQQTSVDGINRAFRMKISGKAVIMTPQFKL